MAENSRNAEATHSAGAQDAGTDADLDSLLNEYDSKSKEQQAPRQQQREAGHSPDALEKIAPILQYVEDKRRDEQRSSFEKSVTEAVQKVKGNERLQSMPDVFVRGFLYDYAERNPDFDKAFREQTKNPGAWQSWLDKAAADAAGVVEGIPDKSVTAAVHAARAAVNGETETVPDDDGKPKNDELMGMSDAQFARYKQRLASQRQPRR